MEIFVGIIIVIIIVLALNSKKGNTKPKPKNYTNKSNYRKKSAEELGKEGEGNVKEILGSSTIGVKHVFNDYVIFDNGHTTQIDHIIVNRFGVFVIETKNYSGAIYGREEDHEWTQVLGGGNEKHKLYNPIKQNASHIHSLKKIIGDAPVRSLIVLVQNNAQNINSNNVIGLKSLQNVLYSGAVVLSPTQIDSIGEKLTRNNKRPFVSNEVHVNNVKRQQDKVLNNICPRCNAPLVLKKGKYGDFWGCSNYPNCKFIKKR